MRCEIEDDVIFAALKSKGTWNMPPPCDETFEMGM